MFVPCSSIGLRRLALLVVVFAVSGALQIGRAQRRSAESLPKERAVAASARENAREKTRLPNLWSKLGIVVVESSTERLVVDYTPLFQGFDTVRLDGVAFLRPRIAGASLEGARTGEALVAELRVPLTVPSPEGFRLGAVNVRNAQSISSLMFPRTTPRVKADDFGVWDDRDRTAYQSRYRNAETPAWGALEYAGIARDRHLAILKLRPARFNAQSSSIEMPQTMRVTVEFTPVANSFTGSLAGQADNGDDGVPVSLNHAETRAWRTLGGAKSFSLDERLHSAISGFNGIGNGIGNGAVNSTANGEESLRKGGGSAQSVAGRWLKIGIEREGIYRITAEQLRSAGITVSNAEISSLRLFGNGGEELPELPSLAARNVQNEQPLLVETDANGALQAITFYGAAPNGFVAKPSVSGAPRIEHFVNTFSRRNFYMLNVGVGVQGRRVTFEEPPAAQVSLRPTYHISRIFNNEDLENPYDFALNGSGRRWFGRRFSSNRATRIETPLPNIAADAPAPVLYRISAAWNKPSGVGLGGQIFVRENTTSLFAVPFDFPGSGNEYTVGDVFTRSSTLPVSAIQNNRSSLEFLYISADGDNANGILDWFEIHYPRRFVAADNRLEFFTDTPENQSGVAEYAVQGFSGGGQIFIVDGTNRAQPRFLRNLSQTPNQALFRAGISPSAPRRFFLSSQTLAVASLERVEDVADLRGQSANADLIVITHKDLLASAEAYGAYRRAQGELAVVVVTTDQIYYQFSAGLPDPTAIRDYISHAYRTWTRKPRYVLFWGDGHFDYRNLSPGNAAKNFVPTYQSYDDDGEMNSVNTNLMTEDYFVCINGDDNIVDLALGRLCISSNEEGERILSKIRRYETAASLDNWRTQLIFTADDGPTKSLAITDRNLHVNQSENLANFLVPSTMRIHKTYLPDFPPENTPGGRRRPGATQDLVAAVNRGALILNWVGHGNPRVWADEQFLQRDITIAQFTNLDRLFFLVAATCDFARFDNFRERCGSEEMMSSSRGGAIGVFAATRTVYATENAAISEGFYRQIFRNHGGVAPRMGDLLWGVKQTFFAGFGDNDRKFCLLGDPTVRLALPEKTILIDSLNGKEIATAPETAQAKALSRFSVSGFIADATGLAPDSSFNGSVLASLHDSDLERAVADIDLDRTIHRIRSLGGLLNIGAGQARNGRFRLTMPIPKDISYSDRNGRLFIYAVDSEGKRFGKGATMQFIVGGLDETAVNDGAGPDIRLFLDSRTFLPGDFVSATPRLIADLYDETGVNATGTGIGHDIQCWIDNNPLPITLTQSYRVSLEDPRRGTVERILPQMTPGLHRIRVRAWDIFNNFSESETYFRVVGENETLVLTELMNYPNPFADATTIRFRHNQVTEQPYTATIYAINGAPVKQFSGSTSARTMEILWDGTDESGARIANGVYIVQVQIVGADGVVRRASATLMRSR